MRFFRNAALAAGAGIALVLAVPAGAQSLSKSAGSDAQDDKPVAIKLVDQFNTLFGKHPGFRANHAKGVVVEGTFTPAPSAAKLSSAIHLQKKSTPVTIRFSNASGLPDAPDIVASQRTRGIAIKFHLADGSETDLIGITLKGFPVRTGEDFLALLQAVGKSGPDAPKPTPVQEFVAAHPSTGKILAMPQPVPVSYATAPYYSCNAFKFTNAKGEVKFGRYQIVPVAAPAYVKPEAEAKLAPNALTDNLRTALAKHPIKYKIRVQIAGEGDPTNDATQIWPDSRPTIELGTLTLTKAVADSLTAEKPLLFLPTNLTPGIDVSDDPLLPVRTDAYAESFGRRNQ